MQCCFEESPIHQICCLEGHNWQPAVTMDGGAGAVGGGEVGKHVTLRWNMCELQSPAPSATLSKCPQQ